MPLKLYINLYIEKCMFVCISYFMPHVVLYDDFASWTFILDMNVWLLVFYVIMGQFYNLKTITKIRFSYNEYNVCYCYYKYISLLKKKSAHCGACLQYGERNKSSKSKKVSTFSDFKHFIFQISKFSDFRFQKFQISDFKIFRFQISKFPEQNLNIFSRQKKYIKTKIFHVKNILDRNFKDIWFITLFRL